MINRQKLIEELEAGYECEVGKLKMISVDKAVEIVKSQPPADQWIPCSSGKMPKMGQICLVTKANWFGKPRIEIAGYWLDGWRIKGQNAEVTAWMPLPEPYKGVE